MQVKMSVSDLFWLFCGIWESNSIKKESMHGLVSIWNSMDVHNEGTVLDARRNRAIMFEENERKRVYQRDMK